MKLKINTPKGIYHYKYIPIFLGIKPINKAIAKENLLLLKIYSTKTTFCSFLPMELCLARLENMISSATMKTST